MSEKLIRNEQEAIETLKANAPTMGYEMLRESLDMVIGALEEIQKYRAIGTVEECRETRERQIPKTPDIEGDGYADGQIVHDTWICPGCGRMYEIDYDDYDYCPKCGQHIERVWKDWSEKE